MSVRAGPVRVGTRGASVGAGGVRVGGSYGRGGGLPFPIAVVVLMLALVALAVIVVVGLLYLLVKLCIAIYRSFHCDLDGCTARRQLWVRLAPDSGRKHHLCLEHGRDVLGADDALIRALTARERERQERRERESGLPPIVRQASSSDRPRVAATVARQAVAALEQAERKRVATASAALEARRAHRWRRWVYGPLQPNAQLAEGPITDQPRSERV
jgi:hypothetical protein